MRGFRPGVISILGALALAVASCSPAPQSSAPPESETAAKPEPAPTQVADLEPAGGSAEPPSAAHTLPPPMTEGQGAPEPDYGIEPAGGSSPMPPAAAGDPPPPPPQPSPVAPPPPMPPGAALPPAAANGHGPSAMPPASANGHAPSAMPPAAAGDPPLRNGHSGNKVLSYFQKNRTQIDTKRAFGFVLMPKAAVTAADKRTQKDFCTTVLATMDFMTPNAVAASAPVDVLATYWPVVGSRESYEIKQAFTERNCDDLIAWYDFALARTLATQAGVAELGGPLLITWPSEGSGGKTARDPLVVDFSKANHERASKALTYWFRQVKARPDLWTNRIREGTIRAELADAVNDTAGVLLTVMSGKWDSLTVVASASP